MADTDLSDARLQVEFEEWAVDYVKGMDSRGAYTSPYTQIAWTAWKASAELAMRRVASRPQQGENAGLVKELLDHANEQAALIHVIEDWRDATKRHHKKTEELCRRSASALSRAGNGIPEGWQLVPKEANEAMLHAMRGPFQIDGPEHATERMNAAQYVAALAATPHPEQE